MINGTSEFFKKKKKNKAFFPLSGYLLVFNQATEITHCLSNLRVLYFQLYTSLVFSKAV